MIRARFRRRRRVNLTPYQQRAENTMREARLAVDVIVEGLAICVKSIYDIDDFRRIRALMDRSLANALTACAEAEKIYDDAFSRGRRNPARRKRSATAKKAKG